MKKAETPKRNYNIPDKDMLAKGYNFLTLFREHKAEFTAKFSNLNDPFESNMQAHLDFCDKFARDKSNISDQVVGTLNVDTVMDNGRYIYQYVYSYLLREEPTDLTVRKNYGQPDYAKSSYSHTKFPVLLEQAYLYTNEAVLKQKLIEKGLKESEILELHLAGLAISEYKQAQKSIKGTRTVSTKVRILSLNKVWADMSSLNDASKIVFMNNYAMHHVFLLYSKGKNKDNGKDK